MVLRQKIAPQSTVEIERRSAIEIGGRGGQP
jgi:hypothetical protein